MREHAERLGRQEKATARLVAAAYALADQGMGDEHETCQGHETSSDGCRWCQRVGELYDAIDNARRAGVMPATLPDMED